MLAPTVALSLMLVSSVTSSTAAPSRPWVASPLSMISLAMRWAKFDGIAKPTPMLPLCPLPVELPALAMATLIPMTLPSESSSAPPELPGLIAASVWITASEIVAFELLGVVELSPPFPFPGTSNCQKLNGLSGLVPWPPLSPELLSSGTAEEAIWILRLSELMMPSVTVPVSPSGAPIAMAVSPTLSLDESLNSAGTRLVTPSALMTARSAIGSVPMIFALNRRPSLVVISTVGLAAAPSRVTTCVLVRM